MASGAAAVDDLDPPLGASLPGGVDWRDSRDLFLGSARDPLPDAATLRRGQARQDSVDVGNGLCEARSVSIFSHFQVLHCNIRGFVSHRAELDARLQLLSGRPAFVCINETFLDESVHDDQIGITGYRLVSRRDRCDGRSGGGILCLVDERYDGQVVMQEHSDTDERTWHIIHSDVGPILCAAWYRPPCAGEIASIQACEDEWRRLSSTCVASFILGDLNVHHTRWLRHSSAISVEGTALLRFCQSCGLKQRVLEPTRDEHLLDLVLSDVAPSRLQVLPTIADHSLVLCSFDFGVPESIETRRRVYDYSKADWGSIGSSLAAADWSSIDSLDVDGGERLLHSTLQSLLDENVPQRTITERKSVHPWVNSRCLEAIATKNAQVGSPDFSEQAAVCSRILFGEYLTYVARMRDKLARERRGSKGWWRVANEIMEKDGKSSSIPTLKVGGAWVREPLSKANAFANNFSSKFVLPALEHNEFSAYWPPMITRGFLLVRSRHVEAVLRDLDVDSGTGPDGVATRVLKYCCRELSVPIAKIVRRILACGFWPTAWTDHWLLPLYKRKAPSDPDNYRAINLTAQVSKVVERFLRRFFAPTLEQRFGSSQFAYRKGYGARDALLLYSLSWIAAFNDGFKVGIYCSDVQGAFDKVSADLLMNKLSAFSLNVQLLRVIRSWLRDRRGYIVVNGQKSDPIVLRNMVFQGTVWGSCLWNAFFSDCFVVLSCDGFEAIIYADDCNAYKRYPRQRSNASILEDLEEVQRNLHGWGRANSVTFDAGKEETMIAASVGGQGGPVKLLGVEYDNKLVMATAVHKCSRKAAFKTKTLLRTRRFYSVHDLILLFKSHILSFLEYRTPGIHYASTSVLNELDDVQVRFLKEIGVDEECALMRFNLAPLCVRRDIAILGVIHRAVLRQGPPQFFEFFHLNSAPPAASGRRGARHPYQLAEWPAGRNLDLMRRSALGMIRVYNLLPENVVETSGVKEFQSLLSGIVRDRVMARDHRWRSLLSSRHPLFQFHPLVYTERS